MRLLAITSDALSVEALVAAVEGAARPQGEGCGAVTAFVGVVRASHQGRRVRYLVYEAFDTLTERVFEQIRREVATEWPGTTLAIHHRVGRLEIGEASVVVAAASAHRAAAFQVCRYAIERVKQVAPIWKHEYYEDGERWIEGAVADPHDEAARETARARACA